MLENTKKGALTKEQVDALEALCSFRQWLKDNLESAINEESPEFEQIEAECSDSCEDEAGTMRDTIWRLFRRNPFNRCSWNTLGDWSTHINQEEFLAYCGLKDVDVDSKEARSAWRNYCLEIAVKTFDKIDWEIGNFLNSVH